MLFVDKIPLHYFRDLKYKMNLNLDSTKQSQETIFSRKVKKLNNPSLLFNYNFVFETTCQKYLRKVLDIKLKFIEY